MISRHFVVIIIHRYENTRLLMGNAHAYNHKNYDAKQNIVRQTKVLASRKHEK